MTLNPILDGIKRGFDCIVSPKKKSSLREDIQEEYGGTLHYDNHHELIHDIACFTADYITENKYPAHEFLMAALRMDRIHPVGEQIFAIWDEHIYRMSCHVALLEKMQEKQTAGKDIHWDYARSSHKLKANTALMQDMKTIGREDAEQLTDHALKVDDLLQQASLGTSPIINIIRIAAETYYEGDKDAPHRITERMHAYKIKNKQQPVARAMVESIRDMVDMNSSSMHHSLRNLFVAALESDKTYEPYKDLSRIAKKKNKSLLKVKHNFDEKAFDKVYDEFCDFDNKLFVNRVESMVWLFSRSPDCRI